MRTMEAAWLTVFVALMAFGSFGLCGFGGDSSTGGQHTWPFSSSGSASTDPDLEVRQFFHAECEQKLNEQITEELKASHLYLSMAHYFSRSDIALYGFHKLFKKMSDEERDHAQMLMEYVNKRGGTISMESTLTFPHQSKLQSGNWDSALHTLKAAMKMEHHVNRHLKEKVHQCGVDHDDFHLQDYIEGTFLTEQVDSIKMFGDYITKVTRLGNGVGLHMFDQELEKK